MPEQGFSRQLNTPVDIPDIQISGPSNSTAGDVAQLITFGASIFAKREAEQKEEARQLKLNELTGKAQKITSGLLSAVSPKGTTLSPVEQAIFVDKAVSAASASPLERDFLMQEVAKGLKSDLFASALQQEKSEDDLLNDELYGYPKEIQAITFAGKEPVDMTKEEKLKSLSQARDLSLLAEKDKINRENLSKTPNARNYALALESMFDISYSANQFQLASLMREVEKQGGDPANMEILSQAKSGMVSQLRVQEEAASAMYNTLLSTPSLTKEDLQFANAAKDNALKNIKDMREALDKMDNEQFSNASKMAEYMKSKLEVELRESAPEIFKLKEVAGNGYNSLMSVLLNRLPQFQNAGVNVIEKGALKVFLDSPEGQATIAKTFDMAEMNRMLGGKALGEYDREKQDTLAGMRWGMIAPLVEAPEMMDQLPEEAVNNVTIAMIHVLDRADEIGDEESLINANRLLSSPAVEMLIGKTKDEQTRRVLSNYVASSTSALFGDKLKSTFGDWAVYNADSKKFELSESALQAKPSGGKGGQLVQTQRLSQRNQSLKEMNNKLEHAANLLVKHNPAIESKEQARDYLLMGAPDRAIKGKLNTLSDIQREAIDKAVQVQEIEKKVQLSERVQQFGAKVEKDVQEVTKTLAGAQAPERTFEEDPAVIEKLRIKAIRKANPDLDVLTDEEIKATFQ